MHNKIKIISFQEHQDRAISYNLIKAKNNFFYEKVIYLIVDIIS